MYKTVIPKGVTAGLQGQVWTWVNGQAEWANLPPPVSAPALGYVFAPITPLLGSAAPITVFTIVFPTSGTTVTHMYLQGICLDVSDDASVSMPVDLLGNFRAVDLSPPQLATVNEVGLEYSLDTSWHWQSVTNVDHNELSLILTPDPNFWSTSCGLPTTLSATSQWTFNFQLMVRNEYCKANPVSSNGFMPEITSAYLLYTIT